MQNCEYYNTPAAELNGSILRIISHIYIYKNSLQYFCIYKSYKLPLQALLSS